MRRTVPIVHPRRIPFARVLSTFVGERDGEDFAVTADWSPSRVTVAVVDDAATSIIIG